MKKLIFDLDNTLLFVSKDWSIHFQKFINKYNLNITLEHLFNSIERFEKNNSDIIVENDYFLKYLCDKNKLILSRKIFKESLTYPFSTLSYELLIKSRINSKKNL